MVYFIKGMQMKRTHGIDPSIMQTLDWAPVWVLDKITIVPDYEQPDVWVLPGGREVTAEQLTAAGAMRSYTLLWPRPWC